MFSTFNLLYLVSEIVLICKNIYSPIYTQGLSTACNLQEDDDAELSLFKVERNQNNSDMLPWKYIEVLLVPHAWLMVVTHTQIWTESEALY